MKKLSEEHKRKIGLSKVGRKRPDLSLRNSTTRIWLGKKHKEETKRKIALALSKEKHYNWKGGKSGEN